MTDQTVPASRIAHAPRRRALMAGAAWSVPAVVVGIAAPAYAASCAPVTATTQWASSQYVRTSSTSGAYTVPGTGTAGSGMTIGVTSVFGSNTRPGDQVRQTNNNLVGIAGPRGGGITGSLELHQSPISNYGKTDSGTRQNSQTITFTFSKPVTGLSFSILDIDSAAWDFRDAVVVVASGGTVSSSVTDPDFLYSSGGTVYSYYANGSVDDTSSRGNAAFRVSGTITSLSITLYNATASYDSRIDGDQAVFISPMSFSYQPC